ncbi:hypothetical protein Q7P37_009760 [Cladosporium fusiforme]
MKSASVSLGPSHLRNPHVADFEQNSHEVTSNETLGFERIFVLNLPSRPDRRDSMSLAAAYIGLEVEFVNGVDQFDNKVLPPGEIIDAPTWITSKVSFSDIIGGAHLTLDSIVERKVTSALVLEDDIDWDIRIKSQMATFAKAAKSLTVPRRPVGSQLDETYPSPDTDQGQNDLDLDDCPAMEPTDSPYGDTSIWDVLWVGHCGCRFPRAGDLGTPRSRIVISNDKTVPEHRHLDMEFGTDELLKEYPVHTRVVSRARTNTCSLAYGVSQAGARRLLYELGIHKMNAPFDLMLRSICDGGDDREPGTCITVQPQLFQHHRPMGLRVGFSDINNNGDGFNDRASTANIRWSTRVNFLKLQNDARDYIDSFEDTAAD